MDPQIIFPYLIILRTFISELEFHWLNTACELRISFGCEHPKLFL